MVFLLNPYVLGAAVEPAFDPDSVAGLSMWYDPSDPATLTLSGSEVTSLDNKASTGSLGDLFSAASGPTLSAINSRPALEFDGLDALWITNPGFAGNLTGTGGFRVFVVFLSKTGNTTFCTLIRNCNRDANGGAWGMNLNNPSAGTGYTRAFLNDEQPPGNVSLLDHNGSINDGAAHVVMLGRKVGTGAGGVDQHVGSFDATEHTPVDMAAGFGSTSNDGTLTSTNGRFALGARALTAGGLDRYADNLLIGEVLVYAADLSPTDEAAVRDYLTQKWLTVPLLTTEAGDTLTTETGDELAGE